MDARFVVLFLQAIDLVHCDGFLTYVNVVVPVVVGGRVSLVVKLEKKTFCFDREKKHS